MQKKGTEKRNSAKRGRIEPKAPKVARVRLKDLRPAKYNPRIISDEALAGLTTSIEKFGCVEPIIVNTRGGKNTIIGGHQRYRVLQEQKTKTALCVCLDLSIKEEKILNLALNNPKTQGEFITDIGIYIEKLKRQIPEEDYLKLRMEALRKELAQKGDFHFRPNEKQSQAKGAQKSITKFSKIKKK